VTNRSVGRETRRLRASRGRRVSETNRNNCRSRPSGSERWRSNVFVRRSGTSVHTHPPGDRYAVVNRETNDPPKRGFHSVSRSPFEFTRPKVMHIVKVYKRSVVMCSCFSVPNDIVNLTESQNVFVVTYSRRFYTKGHI